MLRENLKNLTYQSIAQIVPRAIMLLFTFYLINILGSIEYGKFDFALSFAYLIAVFFELGGNILLTKYVARGLYSSFKLSIRFRILSIISKNYCKSGTCILACSGNITSNYFPFSGYCVLSFLHNSLNAEGAFFHNSP